MIMRPLILLFLLPFLTFAEDVTKEIRITDKNVFYFYESRAEIKAPFHELAGHISNEYRNAQDEFVRQDILEQIKPILEEQLNLFESTNEVFLEVDGQLAEYDFEKNVFPIRLSKENVFTWTVRQQYAPPDGRQSTLFRFDKNYAVALTNPEEIKFLPLPLDNAREFASELRSSRRAVFKISGRVVGVKGAVKTHYATEILKDFGANICCLPEEVEFPTGRHMIKLVEIDVTKIEVTLASGKKVGEINL